MCSDSDTHRSTALANGALDKFIELAPNVPAAPWTRALVFASADLCRGRAKTPVSKLIALLPIFTATLSAQDSSLWAKAFWGFSYLTDGEAKDVQRVLDLPGVMQKAADILSTFDQSEILTPVLRLFGNVFAADDEQAAFALSFEPLSSFLRLLLMPNLACLHDVCWCIANLLACQDPIRQRVFDSGVLVPLIKLAYKPAPRKVRREALWCISNLLLAGDATQLSYLLDHGGIPPLVASLSTTEAPSSSKATKDLQVSLSALFVLLTAAPLVASRAKAVVIEQGIFVHLRALAAFEDHEVRTRLREITAALS
eukprot:m.273510 g.273510  ORF g.273510 m.273510 type:complete len:312 (+) comp54820_c1_seq3:612-1547(+)